MASFALEESYRDVLVSVAAARGYPTVAEPARVGPMLAKLSEIYNTGDGRDAAKLLPARLAFSFARDVPKAHAAVRELCAVGALAPRTDGPLRMLDVGAGLGAMTIGVARALGSSGEGKAVSLHATWIDTDRAAMELGAEIAKRAPLGPVQLSVSLAKGSAASAAQLEGPFDLVVCGQVISELDGELSGPERVEKHAAWLVLLSKLLAPGGSLVIVEPALATRTRHLHAVRDALLASSSLGVFAPCLHREACPALSSPHDWCHEDLPIDLPEWLVPLARAAGLRWQGLTFSYLVLRKDGLTLRSAAGRPLRVTSSRLVTKGKTELFLCGQHADGVTRGKLRLLDRDRGEANTAFVDAERGDLLTIEPAPTTGGRITPDMRVLCTRVR
jgi:2-polyprenyl-3-methyl-5-hydroxy-6-metoxy-1,4-benzoquinol methylase